jgi:cyclophilin family peptidyl-prolyl cis-trans isomerase
MKKSNILKTIIILIILISTIQIIGCESARERADKLYLEEKSKYDLTETINYSKPEQKTENTTENTNNLEEETNMIKAIMKTNKGDIELELYKEKTPITVENFINLSNKGYYDNLTFHRVIKNFMIQGGDPKGDGTGGPGYTIPDEFDNSLKFNDVGILAMANAGPNTGGSQFFITTEKTPWLDNKHTIFGKVINGYNIVEEISNTQTGKNDKPIEPIIIETIEIIE